MMHAILLPILLLAVVTAPLPKPAKVQRQIRSATDVSTVLDALERPSYSNNGTPFKALPQTAFDAGREISSLVFGEGFATERANVHRGGHLDRTGDTLGWQAGPEEQRCVREARSRSENVISEACSGDDERECEDVRSRSAAQLATDIAACEEAGRQRARERQRVAEQEQRNRQSASSSQSDVGFWIGFTLAVVAAWALAKALPLEEENGEDGS